MPKNCIVYARTSRLGTATGAYLSSFPGKKAKGHGWVPGAHDALRMTKTAAERLRVTAERLDWPVFQVIELSYYTTERYPMLLVSGGNHEIWGNPETGQTAAIGVSGGCTSTSFGGRAYFRGHITRLSVDETVTAEGRRW